MTKKPEFEISNGVLQKYNGAGGVVVIPETVQIIGGGAFEGCQKVTEVVIPRSVVKILGRAFRQCTRLVRVGIPDSVYSIGECAFENCIALTEIVIPDSVTELESGAFMGCSALNRVVLGGSLKAIKVGTFLFCRSITEIVIPDSVKELEFGAFGVFDTGGFLRRLVIGNSVRKVGMKVFNGREIQDVEIGDSFTEDACDCLKNLKIGNIRLSPGNMRLRCVDGVIYSADMKKLILYPSGRAGDSFIIPDTVTCITKLAFYSCGNLRRVVIPDSVTNIEKHAFHCCEKLCVDNLPPSVKSIGVGAFSGIAELVVPNGLKSECLMVLQEGEPPKIVHLSFDFPYKLTGEFNVSVIKGILSRWKRGLLSENETERAVAFIRGQLLRTFSKLGEDVTLYEFATVNNLISRQNLQKLLEKTESLECRVVLLEYYKKFQKGS